MQQTINTDKQIKGGEMNEDIWYKILGGVIASAIIGFLSAALGIKTAQAKMEVKQKKMEENIVDKISSLEKLMDKQTISMGREIQEVKQEVRQFRADLYAPKIGD